MKKLICLLFGSLIFNLDSANAITEEVADAKPEISVSGKLAVSSIHLDELSGEKISSRIFIQPEVTIEAGSFYATVSVGAVDVDANFSKNSENSVGAYAGATGKALGIGYDLGVGFADYQNTTGDLAYLYATLEKEVAWGMTPYLTLERDIATDGTEEGGGTLWRIGIKKSVTVREREYKLNLSLGGHDGAYGYDPELISSARLRITTEMEIFGVKAAPEVTFQKGFGGEGAIAADAVMVGLRFSF